LYVQAKEFFTSTKRNPLRIEKRMSKRQLIALFVCSFVPPAVGTGLLGLMPVYLTRLGADPAVTGFYFAISFLALAISTIIGGRLSDRLQHRKALLIAGGLLAIPLAWLMTEATTIAQLTIFSALLSFAGGIVVTMVNILAGLFAEEHERGRVFGIIAFGVPLSGLFSGLTTGPIVDRWGFPALFMLSTLLYIVVPVVGLFLKDKVVVPVKDERVSLSLRSLFNNRTFIFLFFASVVAHLANSVSILGRPLMMDSLDFGATAIASTGAVGSLVILPLPILIGWLSDRLGRKPFLALCYLLSAIGLVALAFSSELWHFWAAAALQGSLIASLVVGSALITDTFPQEVLGSPLSLFNATPWIGFVIGFASAGAAMNVVGMTSSLLSGAVLALVAIVILLPIQKHRAEFQVEQA
jgi:MFS family permease